MAESRFNKDPADVVDFQGDWSPVLVADTIATSTWTVPTGIVKDSDTNTTTTATIWLSGGTAGVTYTLANKIVTAGGRTYERSIEVVLRNL